MNPVSPYAAMIDYVKKSYPNDPFAPTLKKIEHRAPTPEDLSCLCTLLACLQNHEKGERRALQPLLGRIAALPPSCGQASVLGALAAVIPGLSRELSPDVVTPLVELLPPSNAKEGEELLSGLTSIVMSPEGNRHAALLAKKGIFRKIAAIFNSPSLYRFRREASKLFAATMFHATDDIVAEAFRSGIVKPAASASPSSAALLSFYPEKMTYYEKEALLRCTFNSSEKIELIYYTIICTNLEFMDLIYYNNIRKNENIHEEIYRYTYTILQDHYENKDYSRIHVGYWLNRTLLLTFLAKRVVNPEDRIGFFCPTLINSLKGHLNNKNLSLQNRCRIIRILHRYAASPTEERKRYFQNSDEGDPVIRAFRSQEAYDTFRNHGQAFETTQLCMRISQDKRYHLPKHIIALIGTYNILQLNGNP